MLCRLIGAKWAVAQGLKPDTIEGDLSLEEILEYNASGYNAYAWPNYPSPSAYERIPLNPRTNRKRPIKGSDVDTFEWVFADMDLKDKVYASKEEFIALLLESPCTPTRIVDSGGGVHAYWRVTDLDAKSFLRLNRRLSTHFKTDPAVSTLNQLMRIPGTLNVKDADNYKLCEAVWDEEITYDAETLDKWLPMITPEDEDYCVRHYDQAHNIGSAKVQISDELPPRFLKLCKQDKELNDLYFGQHKDRSAADFRLGLKLFNLGFKKEEALAVLCRTAKASERSKVHQYNYALNIADKVWEAGKEASAEEEAKRKEGPKFKATSMADVLNDKDALGERIYCHPMLDATESGFRLGQVLGLIGGAGNGKTTTALNIFRWFTEFNVNKNFFHLFVSLEMPKADVAKRWKLMREVLYQERPDINWDGLVYILDNYEDDGSYRELSLEDVQEYVLELEKQLGRKCGCLVVDHIGVLKQKKAAGEADGLIGICKRLKSVAVATNTFFIIQSQTSRAKNGGGDIELDMDAAFMTSNFEFFADYIFTTWQPLKRVYNRMTEDRMLCVTAFKMAKVRLKDLLHDKIKADTVYGMAFEPKTELLREMTADEHQTYKYWNKIATDLRNKDRKRDPSELVAITWTAKKRESDTDKEGQEAS